MPEKADIVVFRNQSGKLMVRPSVFIVGKASGNNKVTIRNDAEKRVHIIVPHDNGFETEVLEPAANGNNHKKNIDVTDKKQNQSRVVYYHVYLDSEEAQGESAPALIIDD